MYRKLLSIGKVAPVPLTPIQPPYPSWYKPDLTCEYHAGIAGHSIHTCNAFKRKLLQLIKAGWITFEDAPNVTTNPLPNHASGSGSVNMLEVEHSESLKMPMDRICQMMVDAKYKEAIDEEVFMMEAPNKEVCRVQFTTERPPKLILTKPIVAQKGDYNVLPHDYGYSFESTQSPPIFQAEIGGLTRSGRSFTPEELEKQRKAKGKEGVDVAEEINNPVTEEETNEFLKLMKHSEYSVVEQLKKAPAKISLLSLILSSEPHRQALQKVLNEAYVPQDLNQEAMEHLVGRIQASNYVYFTEDELGPDGIGHNKPLYITVHCKDILIGKVLIDNGSALNVILMHMLKEILVDESHMKPSTLMAKAYDGSPRQIIGTLEVELYVGPHMFLITLQVMDIHPSYNILLGRPWIHAAEAVASSLQQCLKDGNVHAFEIVNAEWVPEGAILRKPRIPETARMAAKCFLKNGAHF
ncbi:PREDICTED: uncharacterized protein LOC105114041 [Populus euphratica]|uniref:Uncharacterized protein LOC105114041 n=1 Tax=Populus euphratica TaxID=75702 RepID=A0AAJ6TDI0_POPEU|nr:PREDICTED: uncharacterized protein LOC105114041 [Populus euphratica]